MTKFSIEQNNKSKNYLKILLRNYDIDRIRQERALISFTILRRIIPEENTDAKINTEIENSINGVWKRTPSKLGRRMKITWNKKNSVSFAKKADKEVFGSTSISKRTDEYYRKFAQGTIENDILRERR